MYTDAYAQILGLARGPRQLGALMQMLSGPQIKRTEANPGSSGNLGALHATIQRNYGAKGIPLQMRQG